MAYTLHAPDGLQHLPDIASARRAYADARARQLGRAVAHFRRLLAATPWLEPEAYAVPLAPDYRLLSLQDAGGRLVPESVPRRTFEEARRFNHEHVPFWLARSRTAEGFAAARARLRPAATSEATSITTRDHQAAYERLASELRDFRRHHLDQ